MPDLDKAEKLKVNGHDWDRDPAMFVIRISCLFGTATAGDQSDKFTVGADLKVTAGDKTYDLKGDRLIKKVAGAVKDDANFIEIEALRIGWPEGKTFKGTVVVTTTAFITGPSGNVMSTSAVTTDKVEINPGGDIITTDVPG